MLYIPKTIYVFRYLIFEGEASHTKFFRNMARNNVVIHFLLCKKFKEFHKKIYSVLIKNIYSMLIQNFFFIFRVHFTTSFLQGDNFPEFIIYNYILNRFTFSIFIASLPLCCIKIIRIEIPFLIILVAVICFHYRKKIIFI